MKTMLFLKLFFLLTNNIQYFNTIVKSLQCIFIYSEYLLQCITLLSLEFTKKHFMLEVGHNDISEKHIISLMPVIILKHQGLECLIEF